MTDRLVDYRKTVPGRFVPLSALKPDKAQTEATALRKAIRHHDVLYYRRARPAISDAAYDKLYRRLIDLEHKFPQLRSAASPTQRLPEAVKRGARKVRHAALMGSLESVQNLVDVKRFCRFCSEELGGETPLFDAEPKFDGFSVEIVYERGTFRRGSTRGDGTFGEDITENLKMIRALPQRLKGRRVPDFCSLRGESFLSKQGFLALNKELVRQGAEPFSNPRNAASGMLRQLDPKPLEGKPFRIYFYELLAARGGRTPASQSELLRTFAAWGLPVDRQRIRTTSFKEIAAFHGALDITGLGPETVERLLKKGLVHSLADLYRLTVSDLMQLEGFGRRSATQLCDAIQKAKARELARSFLTIGEIARADIATINRLPGLGEKVASSVHSFFRSQATKKLLRELEQLGVRVKGGAVRGGSQPLKGLTFVFTGELKQYTRDEAERLVEDLGGRTSSSVSENTSYVVAGPGAGHKLEDAQRKHAKILTEAAFRRMIVKMG